MRCASIILILCLTMPPLLLPTRSMSAFKSSADVSSNPEQAWNPKPATDDITLPMPCGLSLALRTVGVPSGGLLRDRRFTMGVSDTTNADRQLYEGSFKGYIAAPFTPRDLPEIWRSHLSPTDGDGYTFYFMGKYEITRAQWDAVMNAVDSLGEEHREACPKLDKGFNLPKGGISWFDAQEFLHKINAWLVSKHGKELPRFDGTNNIGFLRLPTEEEWEFAARGGSNVPEEERDNSDNFPMNGKELKDFGVFSGMEALRAPLPVGSRHPNPLGIYDTVGNVREMVDGFFRMSIADMNESGAVYHRLHGAAGGILCKGGSYGSTEDTVLPGWRDEVPLYTAQGPSRPADLGIRIVLAGLNIPNAQRLQTLREENRGSHQQNSPVADSKPQSEKKILRLNENMPPLEALDAVASTVSSPELKSNLAQLRRLMQDRQTAQDRQRTDSMEQIARSLLYQEETMRAFAYRYITAKKALDNFTQLQAKAASSSEKKQISDKLSEVRKDMDGYVATLLLAANYYRNCLKIIRELHDADIRRLFSQFRQEYAGDDIFHVHMRDNISTLEKHLHAVRTKGIDTLNARQIVKDVVPQRHLKALPL